MMKDKQILDLPVEVLTKQAFAPFGDVIECDGAELRMINNGTTQRYHDLAKVEAHGGNARVMISIFRGAPFTAPIDIVMMERHPYGSQAFIPLDRRPFLVVVAQDDHGRPGKPRLFLARGDQGVNYHHNVWHHPLLSLEAHSNFVVVDRDGAEHNLEEYFFADHIYQIRSIAIGEA